MRWKEGIKAHAKLLFTRLDTGENVYSVDGDIDDVDDLVHQTDEVSITDLRYSDIAHSYMGPDAASSHIDRHMRDGIGEMEITLKYYHKDRKIAFAASQTVDPDELDDDCWYQDHMEYLDEEYDSARRFDIYGVLKEDAEPDDLIAYL